MNLLRDVAGRQAKHVADGRRVQIFQVEEDHVAIDRFELSYQLAQPLGDLRFVVVPLDTVDSSPRSSSCSRLTRWARLNFRCRRTKLEAALCATR